MKKILFLYHEINATPSLIMGHPFSAVKHARDFRDFAEVARDSGVEIYFCNYQLFENGVVSSAWMLNGENWKEVKNVEYDLVFDKTPLTNTQLTKIRKWLSNSDVKVFNRVQLTEFFNDKLMYKHLPLEGLLPTFSNLREISEFYENGGVEKADFDPDLLVVKPRYGYGGKDIQFVSRSSFDKSINPEFEKYIVQPFLHTNNGIPNTFIEGRHDLRIILLNGKIIQSYVREPVTTQQVSLKPEAPAQQKQLVSLAKRHVPAYVA